MSSLKSFLYGVAPIVGMSPAALYERQRALVKLGLLTPAPGRGPGSGVPLSADSVAVMIICILTAESLSDVDERVAALCNAAPDTHSVSGVRRWTDLGHPTFCSEISRLLSGEQLQWRTGSRVYRGIRVTRCWRGQIMHGAGALQSIDFLTQNNYDRYVSDREISITAEIETGMLEKLILYTQGALSQTAELEEED